MAGELGRQWAGELSFAFVFGRKCGDARGRLQALWDESLFQPTDVLVVQSGNLGL